MKRKPITMPSKNWAKYQPQYVPPSNDGVTTTVVHLKRYKGQIIQDCDVYIGRRICMGGWNYQQSKWANPFKAQTFGNNRDLLLKRYKEYILSQPELMDSLQELKGKRQVFYLVKISK